MFGPIIWARYSLFTQWVKSEKESVKPLVWNRIFSPHQFEMISVIKETYAVRVLPLYFRTGSDLEGIRVPLCGCLETLATQVSTSFHGSEGEGASQRARDCVEGERKVLVCFKTSVSPGDNGWAVGYKWCILFFSSCWWHKGKKSSSLAYQNTVTFLLPQENFQSQPSAATETKLNNCKTPQCLIKTRVWPLFFYVPHAK